MSSSAAAQLAQPAARPSASTTQARSTSTNASVASSATNHAKRLVAHQTGSRWLPRLVLNPLTVFSLQAKARSVAPETFQQPRAMFESPSAAQARGQAICSSALEQTYQAATAEVKERARRNGVVPSVQLVQNVIERYTHNTRIDTESLALVPHQEIAATAHEFGHEFEAKDVLRFLPRQTVTTPASGTITISVHRLSSLPSAAATAAAAAAAALPSAEQESAENKSSHDEQARARDVKQLTTLPPETSMHGVVFPTAEEAVEECSICRIVMFDGPHKLANTYQPVCKMMCCNKWMHHGCFHSWVVQCIKNERNVTCPCCRGTAKQSVERSLVQHATPSTNKTTHPLSTSLSAPTVERQQQQQQQQADMMITICALARTGPGSRDNARVSDERSLHEVD